MQTDAKIYVAGHQGLVGGAIWRRLQAAGFQNLVGRTLPELDLRNQAAVTDFFGRERPEYVFLAAARVGGIRANATFPAEFIYDNLMIQANLIHQAYRHDVKKLLFLGSSCIYPRLCPQPMKEDYLLDGKLEPTNEPYAVAKIAGIKMCQSYNRQYGTCFISVMPTNLYGPGDNFDLLDSHVMPALIRKFHQAKVAGDPEVVIWGTGTPRREFLYVDDLADACFFSDGALSGGGDHQRRGRSGPADPGVGPGQVAAVDGFNGRMVLDPSLSRRHPPEIVGRQPPDRPGVAGPDASARGPEKDLRLVLPQPLGPGSPEACAPSPGSGGGPAPIRANPEPYFDLFTLIAGGCRGPVPAGDYGFGVNQGRISIRRTC